jgi:hypothetical protein
MRITLMLLVVAMSGCLRKTEFHCSNASDCGRTGACTGGFCAFPDPSCGGGLRYDDSAGDSSNQCIGDSLGDAGVDTSTTIDAPPTGCPSDYVQLPGGSAHVYKVLGKDDMWQNHRSTCHAASASAYLAIPDDATELAALDTLAATAAYWIGVSRISDSFVNDKSMPQTFLPWAPNQPDGEGDCVAALSAMAQFDDLKCNMRFHAVCECEP